MTRAWLFAAGLAALALALPPGDAAAQMYKWTDKNGNLHITDYPPPGGGTPMNLDAIRINRMESGAGGGPAAPGRHPSPPPAAAPAARDYPRVAIYGADW